MAVKTTDAEVERTESVLALVRERVPDEVAPQVEEFVRQYYAGAAPEDLLEHDVLDTYGAAVAHRHLAAERRPGEAKVRVYTPDLEEHGWQSTHTVVEIVNDDMPFLVDSVSAEVDRHGIGIHLVLHPVLMVRRDEEGRLLEVVPPDDPPDDAIAESLIHVEADRQTEPHVLEQLEADLRRVLGDVRAAVEDWQAMRQRALEIVAALESE
ncbi:MAG TPA: NAD-glutamate dehydrogenase, partial [Actinomycetota bacterium]|nr:NAD-glutamate dehydrogenase [Actinomycetota bacterium]